MKKELIGFIAGCAFTATALIGGPALADAYNQNINVDINKVTVFSEYQKMSGDTILWNNKTYIPMRETLEKANCTVNYNSDTNVVEVMNKFHKDITIFAVNGVPIPKKYGAIYMDNVWSETDSGIHYYIDMRYFVDAAGFKQNYCDYGNSAIVNFYLPQN